MTTLYLALEIGAFFFGLGFFAIWLAIRHDKKIQRIKSDKITTANTNSKRSRELMEPIIYRQKEHPSYEINEFATYDEAMGKIQPKSERQEMRDGER